MVAKLSRIERWELRRFANSPYAKRARDNKAKRLLKAGLLERVIARLRPIRKWGESEMRFPIGPFPKWTKFKYNKGKHFKIAGGAMRHKASRVSQHSNYDNVQSVTRQRHAVWTEREPLLRDILDHRAKVEEIANTHFTMSKRPVSEAPAVLQHFGVLSHLNKKPE